MQRVPEDEFEELSSGPTTRRISYISAARTAEGVGTTDSPRTIGSLSEDDESTEVERARLRLEQSAIAFGTTVKNTCRDVLMAARSLGTCMTRWVAAERTRVASTSPRQKDD